jgi:hypothetical protein
MFSLWALAFFAPALEAVFAESGLPSICWGVCHEHAGREIIKFSGNVERLVLSTYLFQEGGRGKGSVAVSTREGPFVLNHGCGKRKKGGRCGARVNNVGAYV